MAGIRRDRPAGHHPLQRRDDGPDPEEPAEHAATERGGQGRVVRVAGRKRERLVRLTAHRGPVRAHRRHGRRRSAGQAQATYRPGAGPVPSASAASHLSRDRSRAYPLDRRASRRPDPVRARTRARDRRGGRVRRRRVRDGRGARVLPAARDLPRRGRRDLPDQHRGRAATDRAAAQQAHRRPRRLVPGSGSAPRTPDRDLGRDRHQHRHATLQTVFYARDVPAVLAVAHIATGPAFATLVAVTVVAARRTMAGGR